MATELRSENGVVTAVLSGSLDAEAGADLVQKVRDGLPRGGQLVVEGSRLTALDQHGIEHLMEVHRWIRTAERKRLVVAGFNAAIWAAVEENGIASIFDRKPTLAEALKASGVAPGPASPASLARPALDSHDALEDQNARVWVKPGDTRSELPGGFSPPAPPVPQNAEDDPWSKYQPSARDLPPARAFPRSWLLGGAVAVAALLLGAVIWWWLASRSPSLLVFPARIEAEEGGAEVDGVKLTIHRGQLRETSADSLPAGLHFERVNEDSTEAYALRGSVASGAHTATLELVAESTDGSKVSAPVSFTVTVTPKPPVWQLKSLASLSLRVGHPVTGYAKFLTGAAQAPAAAGLPPGLEIRPAGSGNDWQLGGTPTKAGAYEVKFKGQAGEAREEAPILLKVEEEPVAPIPKTDLPKPPPVPGLEDGMRKFLLERIEKLPARYTVADRDHLREVVGALRKARLVHKVVFANGQAEVSADEAKSLKEALNDPEFKLLTAAPGFQMVIVGYASPSGSMAGNVLLSKQRAGAVEKVVRQTLGRNADLCGDYGPTDAADLRGDQTNRAVEIYAGTIEVSADLQQTAQRFKQDFQRRHGAR